MRAEGRRRLDRFGEPWLPAAPNEPYGAGRPVSRPARRGIPGRHSSRARRYTPEIYRALRHRWERHQGGEFNYTEGVEDLEREGSVVI